MKTFDTESALFTAVHQVFTDELFADDDFLTAQEVSERMTIAATRQRVTHILRTMLTAGTLRSVDMYRPAMSRQYPTMQVGERRVSGYRLSRRNIVNALRVVLLGKTQVIAERTMMANAALNATALAKPKTIDLMSKSGPEPLRDADDNVADAKARCENLDARIQSLYRALGEAVFVTPDDSLRHDNIKVQIHDARGALVKARIALGVAQDNQLRARHLDPSDVDDADIIRVGNTVAS